MFKNATLKLTVSYLSVVMIISILFSAVVYRVGSDNLTFGLTHESQELSAAFPIFAGTQFARPNPTDLNNGRNHLLDEIILTNLVVLVGGGLICYVLARETLKPIEEAHEQQKRFVADVSHELRTPLTALRMESEVALMDPKIRPDDLKKVIGSNIEEAEKLETLINNLMRLARLEAGELQRQFSNLEFDRLAKEAISKVKPQAKAKGISVKLGGDPVSIKGDRDSLVQMLVIFLDNAIKYSPGKTSVELVSKKGSNGPAIEIIDHGSGIKAENLEHVFDRFYRADSSRSGSSGFGLGLSIAKLIADIHKADITITSSVGVGTTVRVSFED